MALIERFSTIENGSMVFTGNTIGLSKANGQEIGAFISLDNTLQAPGYPVGTTLTWQENGSSADLDYYEFGSEILYAELQWGGSSIANPSENVTADLNTPVTFNTPSGQYTIANDPATAQAFDFLGNQFYSRSADVTSIIIASGSGTYSVEGVPATIIPGNFNINGAMWSLGIIYRNEDLPLRSMTLYAGLQGILGSTTDFNITGFIAPPFGPVEARVLISAMEGDPGGGGDNIQFGEDTLSLVPLQGPNNLVTNFFASQINDGNSESSNVGELDTTGTFGNVNATPGVIPPQGVRYGADVTNVQATNFTNEQMTAVVRLTSTGDAYGVPLMGIQLDAVLYDFGDAPDTSTGNGPNDYTTLFANNGPRHGQLNDLKLGVEVTNEMDAYQNANATGDDNSKSIQDDGIFIVPAEFSEGLTTYKLPIRYTNNAGTVANVYAWIDFNRDGIFQGEEAAEPLVVLPSASNPRTDLLTFNVPPGTTLVENDFTFLRIRLTTMDLQNTNLLPTDEDTRSIGPASDGEVEDFRVNVTESILDFGDAPDTGAGNGTGNYSTLLANDGPRHYLRDGLTLGASITREDDAYQDPQALGDDTVVGFQDDGVEYPVSPIISGDDIYEVTVSYVNDTGENAYIYAWVDFNRNGIFELEESAELIVVPSISNAEMQATLKFNIPNGSVLTPGDDTFMRIRLTTEALVNTNILDTDEDTRSIGVASDGEVEDYIIQIINLNVSGIVWYDVNCNGIRELGEDGIEGVNVKLFEVSNPDVPFMMTTTDANGNYNFTDLPLGDYFVVVELPNGYSYTLPNVGSNKGIDSDVSINGRSSDFSLDVDNPLEIVDSGLCKCFRVSGQVFYDCNKNGTLEENEPLLCGVLVRLVSSDGEELDCATTDCDGYYKFDCLNPGDYEISFIAPPDMNFTTQDLSYYGSKPDSNTGIASISITDENIDDLFAGFIGTMSLDMDLCTECGACCDPFESINIYTEYYENPSRIRRRSKRNGI